MRFNKVLDALQKATNKEIKQVELAKVLGVSRSNINYKKDNDVNLPDDDVLKIETFYNVSLQDNSDLVDIPVRGEVEASMGCGCVVYNETQTATYSISRQLARDLGVARGFTEMIFAKGNSMYPTIDGGDSLLVDTSKKEIYDGKIYCIRWNGQLYAKRLQCISPCVLKIISDNKDYEPVLLDFSKDESIDFEVIGEVRWTGRVFR